MEECQPASANIVYAPQWILNTISVQLGDKVCVHSIKDRNLYQRGRAQRIQAVLVTPDAIKDILFTGKETGSVNMISETRLKQLVIKGLWRYSYLNLGQYVKVELEPPSQSYGGNNSRPVILRIVSLIHDRDPEVQLEAPFLIGEQFTKVDIHLNYETLDTSIYTLPQVDLNPLVSDLLDFQEREKHVQLIEAV